jgi:hypothetical protein
MKKILFVSSLIILLSAACNSSTTQEVTRDKQANNNNSQVPPSPTAQTPPASKATAPFSCKDIVTDANFKAVMGRDIQEYTLKESVNLEVLECNFDYKKGDSNGVIAFDGLFLQVNYSGDIASTWYAYRDQALKNNPDSPAIGSGAYYFGGLSVLSSNKKYVFRVLRSGTNGGAGVNTQSGKDIAVMIDNNLNKY